MLIDPNNNPIEVTQENWRKDLSEKIDEILKGVKSIKTLTDEEINVLTSNLTLSYKNKTIVFKSIQEAMLYAKQLEENYKEIKFCKFIHGYSNSVGEFFLIEPQVIDTGKDKMLMKDEDEPGLAFVNVITLMAIVERAERLGQIKKKTNEDNSKIN